MACGRFVLSWFSVIYCTRCTCSIEPKGQILYEDFQGLTFRHSKPCSKRFPGAVNKSCEVANGMTIDKRVEGGFSVIPPTPYKFLEPVPTSDEKRALVKQTKRRGRGGARARQGEARRGEAAAWSRRAGAGASRATSTSTSTSPPRTRPARLASDGAAPSASSSATAAAAFACSPPSTASTTTSAVRSWYAPHPSLLSSFAPSPPLAAFPAETATGSGAAAQHGS
jgi:hypothetical protein